MVSLKKSIPPPLKEPGTHTNAEVKEALHARALRRSVVVLALVILLLASLVVVSNIASDYTDEEQLRWTPRVVIVSTSGLSASVMDRAMAGNKAPFLSLLNASGGIYGSVAVPRTAGQSSLVPLLTGSANRTGNTLMGAKTFMSQLRAKNISSITVAPETYYSASTTLPNSASCSRVGLLDTECAGSACPTSTTRYCAASRQYISCSGVNCLYKNDILVAASKMINNSASVMLVQVDVFTGDNDSDDATDYTLTRRSRANLLDDVMGTLAVSLAERTRVQLESWLIILTGDGGEREARAPLAMAAYANGELVRLRALPSTAALTDIYGTVMTWFDLKKGVDQARNLGICSDGVKVVNCKDA